MSSIDVRLEGVVAISSWNGSFQTGCVSLVKGAATAGKSSLLRGIQMGIVGSMSNEENDKLKMEAQNIRLADRSDTGMLNDGASAAVSNVAWKNKKWETRLPRNGAVTGKVSDWNPKALYTCLLMRQPATILYKKVSKEGAGSSDFNWITDLSEAPQYQVWADMLSDVEQEIKGLEQDYASWSDEQKEISSRLEPLRAEIKTLSANITQLSGQGSAASEGLSKEVARLTGDLENLETDYDTAKAEYDREALTAKRWTDIIDIKKGAIRTADRSIRDNEGLSNQTVALPDTSNITQRIAELRIEIEVEKGQKKADEEDSDGVRRWDKEGLPDRQPELLEYFDKKREVNQSTSESDEKKNELDTLLAEQRKIENDYLRLDQQVNQAKSTIAKQKQIKALAKSEIDDAKFQISGGTARLGSLEKTYQENKTKFEIQKVRLEEKEEELEAVSEKTPEQIELEDEREEKRAIRDDLVSKQENTYPVRFESLTMSKSEADHMTPEELTGFLDSFNDPGPANSSLVEDNLGEGEEEIEKLLFAAFKDGSLWSMVTPMREMAETTADSHKQSARRVFNEIGTEIFQTLDFSPIRKLSLNTEYELKIERRDGRVTGLSGSESERAMTAAALLIAMRKSYTPEIPLLMFDAILDTLNPGPREEMKKFLSEYAEKEGIAIIITTLADVKSLVVETL